MSDTTFIILTCAILIYGLIIMCIEKHYPFPKDLKAFEVKEKPMSSDEDLLISLPCKIGDKLYIVKDPQTPYEKSKIQEVTVKEFIYRSYRFQRLEIYFEGESGFETCLFDGTLNEGVFLTRNEALKYINLGGD